MVRACMRIRDFHHTARMRKSHPDMVVCNVNLMVLRRGIFYLERADAPLAPVAHAHANGAEAGAPSSPCREKDDEERAFGEHKARCLASLRALRARLGAEHSVRGVYLMSRVVGDK